MKTHILIFKGILIFFMASAFLPASAQYKFYSKPFKKTFEKAKKAYDDYDYATILDLEADLLKFSEPKKDTLTALVYSFLGESYDVEGDPMKAYDYYKKEYALRQSIQDKSEYNYGGLLFNLAFYAMGLGDYQESEKLFLELVDEDKKTYGNKSEEYARTVKNLADLYKSMGRYKDSETTLRKLMREIDSDNPNYPSVVTNLAILYTATGEYSKSERTFERALELLENSVGSASLDYVVALGSLSFLYQSAGRYSEAEETLTAANSILDRLQGENEQVKSLIYNYTGAVKFRMGLYDDAITYFTRALKIDSTLYGTESPLYAYSLDALGSVYSYMGNHAQSIEAYEEALRIIGGVMGTESFDYSYTQANLALAYINDGQLEKALSTMTEVLATDKAVLGDDHPDYANSVHNMGNLQFKRENYSEADKYYNESLRIRKRALGATHPKYAETTNKLAILKWAQKDSKGAEAFYKETFDNFFTQINAYFPILSEDEKATFYYTKLRTAFEEFNSFAIDRFKDNPALIGDMYNIQLATKGLILYATNKVRESILNSGDTVIINKYQDWISQKEKIAKLYSSNDEELDIRNRKIDSLSDIANTLERELSTASAAFSNTFVKKDYTWQNVRDKLKPGEAAVEIIRFREFKPDSSGIFTDNVYYAALVVRSDTKDNPDLVIIRNGNQMEDRYLANYRNAIRYKIEEDFSYGLFWKPIANKLEGVKKVYLSPDGAFNQISIYTLRNPDTGNYTLDEIEIQVVTNTKDLVEERKPSAFQTKDGKAVLIGYPNYNKGAFEDILAEDAIAASVVTAAAEGRGDSREVRGTRGGTRGTRGSRGSDGEEGASRGLTRGASRGLPRGIRGNLNRYINSDDLLALLPGTKVEVEKINALYASSKTSSEIVLGDNAIETSLKDVRYPRTLHVATHGFFLEDPKPEEAIDTKYIENPLLKSGLIFAGANSFLATGEMTDDDGILTAYEAMNLDLDGTELVVLSACETGLGEIQNGEGVYGLQRAFRVAGAKSMIMSMWTVDDDATQELMTHFYEGWLKTGDKHASFINAQKALKKKYPEPYYWGAFIMVGE
ncbi:MAG: CHAT domain-containing protein [Imperialibacter sp.]|uniref:CHAT domain-containing protein n=1 Tax=Imperialibacter sp. TaxID=2038411 RepID=UPI003A855480